MIAVERTTVVMWLLITIEKNYENENKKQFWNGLHLLIKLGQQWLEEKVIQKSVFSHQS